MAECPVCGLGERCHNHWVAVQEPGGEVEFQAGAMTASEDNLIMLRNKLQNPPLPVLFEKLGLLPLWVREQGRVLAYLNWPLELRGAVHRALFPNGQPGAPPLAPTPVFRHLVEEIHLAAVELDWESCLPDEFVYKVNFDVTLGGVGRVRFTYVQLVWAEGAVWAPHFADPGFSGRAEALLRLLFGGLVDGLRATFAGREADVLADDQPLGIAPGSSIDEVAIAGEGMPELHLGEEIEHAVNQRRIQVVLRDTLFGALRPELIH